MRSTRPTVRNKPDDVSSYVCEACDQSKRCVRSKKVSNHNDNEIVASKPHTQSIDKNDGEKPETNEDIEGRSSVADDN